MRLKNWNEATPAYTRGRKFTILDAWDDLSPLIVQFSESRSKIMFVEIHPVCLFTMISIDECNPNTCK